MGCGSGLASVAGSVAAPFSMAPPVSAPSLFRPFAADSSSVPVSSAPLPSALSSTPSFSSSAVVYPGASSAPAHFAPTPSFAPPEELPDDVAPDALPRDLGLAVLAAVPDSAHFEFRRMLSFIVDLSPQAAGSPSAPPPPRALFEDFFGSSAPPSSPVFLNWFKRVRTALSDADTRMASFLATSRGDFSLPPRNSSYVMRGDLASGHGSSQSVSAFAF